MNSRHILRFVTALLVSGLCWIANGQTTASVFGVVRDASGAVVWRLAIFPVLSLILSDCGKHNQAANVDSVSGVKADCRDFAWIG